MISIIICSINLTYFEKLKTNISETIGLKDYEIIKIDNLKNKWSITHAYNFGYKKAKFNNLLFIHEDILFCNNNWGQIFIQELNEKNIGLLGVAGASYKSIYPSAFWHVPKELLKVNIIQNYKNKTKEIISQGFSTNNNIKAIDGVFLGIKKSLDISFNQKIKGFHCYDLGISLDVLDKGLKLKVSEKILIEHFSIGTTNKTFLKNYISFHKIYKQKIKKI